MPAVPEQITTAEYRFRELFILPTVEAVEELKQHPGDTNAILHVTC